MTPQEQIKEKLDLGDLLSGYMQLKPGGGQNLKGCCPFHSERTPSFYVSKDKQLWHCFGCGLGGDHFAFVMKIEGLDFGEALRMLAERTGVEIPRYQTKESNEKTRLLELVKLAASFYRHVFEQSNGAVVAREYAKKRQIPDTLLEKFGIGYAPEQWDTLAQFLKKRGYRDEEIVKAGLGVARTKGSGIYDRFRGRLMFPIRDANGKPNGFTGRVLNPEAKEAKYVNTPQTPLYDKSAALFGLDQAKSAIREAGFVVIVEGQMDVIGSWRGGVGNVVASSGTALTERQVQTLKRYSDLVCLAFDADAAGLQAARRGIDLLFAAEVDVKIIILPDGVKDPDECTAKDSELWQKAVKEARHIVAYDIERAKREAMNDPLVKKRVVKSILDDVAKLRDAVERDHWLRQIAQEFGVTENILTSSVKKSLTPKIQPSPSKKPVVPDRWEQLSELLLGLFLEFDKERARIIELVRAEAVCPLYRGLYTNCLTFYTTSLSAPTSAGAKAIPATKGLYEWLVQNGQLTDAQSSLFTSAAMKASNRYAEAVSVTAEVEAKEIVLELLAEYRKRRSKEIELLIAEAEKAGDQAQLDVLLKEYHKLNVLK